MSATRLTFVIGVACIALFTGGGCSQNDPGRFRPAADVAKSALSAALDRWARNGQAPLHLDGDVLVELIDKQRPAGQRPTAFRVLGEVSGDGGRWFEVELTLVEPDEVLRDRYVVVGINPLWVFRQADYEMLQHWDHPMPTAPAGATEGAEGSNAEVSG